MATDPEEDILTYTLLAEDEEDSPFEVDLFSGEISLSSSTLNYERTDEYVLNVLVKDNGDPVLSDTILITIEVADEIEGILPSADYISPNGDEKNDTWVIENVELYQDFSLMIFDANGTMLYQVESGYDNSWDGTYNGQYLETGAYYYVLSENQGDRVFKGTISLVK